MALEAVRRSFSLMLFCQLNADLGMKGGFGCDITSVPSAFDTSLGINLILFAVYCKDCLFLKESETGL